MHLPSLTHHGLADVAADDDRLQIRKTRQIFVTLDGGTLGFSSVTSAWPAAVFVGIGTNWRANAEGSRACCWLLRTSRIARLNSKYLAEGEPIFACVVN